MIRRMHWLAPLVAGAVLVTTAGCGAEPEPVPADSVPTLAVTLESVDSLIAEGRWARARAQLRSLIADANAAREAGELSPEEADRIVAAATRLLGVLPTPTPTASPTAVPSPGGAEGKGDRGDRGDEKDDDEDRGKGGDKGKGGGKGDD
jgi:hypothetical protein